MESAARDRIKITPNQIHLITGLDEESSKREHAYIRKSLGFGSPDLLLSQYCDFNDLDFKEVMAFLYPSRIDRINRLN